MFESSTLSIPTTINQEKQMAREKLTLQSLRDYVDGKVNELGERVDGLAVTPAVDETFSDIYYRAEAVREATVKVRAIMEFEDERILDSVLKVAAFLLGETPGEKTIIYNDHYHVAREDIV